MLYVTAAGSAAINKVISLLVTAIYTDVSAAVSNCSATIYNCYKCCYK